ncbi:hypothetical protein MF6394_17835 [Pseudomonas sp. MF6394]|nr:hypothetical protein MF6394_17835 [Pseudomonas sp. MF6394]
MLAKNFKAPRANRLPALSLTIFASKLAPTGVRRARIHLRILHIRSANQGLLCRVVSPPSYPASG